MFPNFNIKQVILSCILLALLVVLGLQITYQRQTKDDILRFAGQDTAFVFELDLSTRQQKCLLDKWCFVEEKDNELQDWLTSDNRRQRLLNFNFDILELTQKAQGKIYLIGYEDKENDLDLVWFAKNDKQGLLYDFITQNDLSIVELEDWLVFSQDEDVLAKIVDDERKSDFSWTYVWPKDIDSVDSITNAKWFGLVNASKLNDILKLDNVNLSNDEKLYFSADIIDDKFNFSFNSKNLLSTKKIESDYVDFDFNLKSTLKPNFVIDKRNVKNNFFVLADNFGLVNSLNPERYLWFNFVSLENEFGVDNVSSDMQVLILPKMEDSLTRNFEDYHRKELAKLLPSERDLILPDGDIIPELIIEPTKFAFENKKLGNYTVKSLVNPSVNYEVVLAYDDEKTIFSSSTEILENLILNNNQRLNEVWKNSNQADKLYFEFDNRTKSYYGLNDILLEDLSAGQDVWIKGKLN